MNNSVHLEEVAQKLTAKEYLDRIRELVRSGGAADLRHWGDGKFVLGDEDGNWHLEGFVNLMQAMHEAMRAVNSSLPAGLPPHCLDPRFIAKFFRIPLEKMNAPGNAEPTKPQPPPRPTIPSPYLDAQQAADYLGMTVKALYNHVERRKLRPLPGYRKYRFTKEQLDAFLRGENPVMKRPTEVCVLPDGRRVKFGLKRRSRDPYYLVRFAGREGRRLEKSTEQASLKRARAVAITIIQEEFDPKAGSVVTPWDKAIDLMVAAMTAQNLRQPSIDDYQLAIRNLRKAFPSARGPADITADFAKQYKLSRQAKGVSPQTLFGNINKLSVIWAKWFIKECKVVSVNPWDEVEMPKLDKLEPRYITYEEQQAFFNWLKTRWDGWRLPLLFFTVKGLIGCRITELCSLPSANLKDGRIIFDAGLTKGRKARRPKLPEDVFKELVAQAGPKFAWERYSEQLRAINKAKGLKGLVKNFSPARLRRFLQNEIIEYCQANRDKPGFRPFSAHDFRGTAMSKAVSAGATVDQASLAFGCHSETMKKHYLTLQEEVISDAVLDRIQGTDNSQKLDAKSEPHGNGET